MRCSGTVEMRRRLKVGIARALSWPPVVELISMRPGSRDLPFIAGYHRVVEKSGDRGGAGIPAQLISRRMLEKHLDWLGRRFRFVSLDELGERMESGATFARPAAAVTFDDGYADVYEHAFPMLRRKGIPAAVFVITGLVGTSRLPIHDRLYGSLRRALSEGVPNRRELERRLAALGAEIRPLEEWARGRLCLSAVVSGWLASLSQERVLEVIGALEPEGAAREAADGMRPLSWEMLVEMSRAGIVIGSHTRTHALLTNEIGPKIREEVAGSRADLESRLGIDVRHFAYPCGKFDLRALAAVASAGYRFAYTTCLHRDPRRPLLTLPRKVLWENSCLDSLGAFSGPILSCQTRWVFDLVTGCREDHSGTGARPATAF